MSSQFERRHETRERNPTPWWLGLWLSLIAIGAVMRAAIDPTAGVVLIATGVIGVLVQAIRHGVWDWWP